MKSRGPASRVLLDTSFILPTLGISVSEETSEGLKRLSETGAEIYYSRFGILESLWVAARTIHDATFDPESFKLGLRSVIEGGRYGKVEEDSEIFNEALRLYELGHKDIVDNILYASSARLDLKLLTLDTELREFVHSKGLKDAFVSPEQLA